ncbi:MAG: LPS export ABC transporter periplasmic protein LptC [Chitinophagaceae bacterium]|nr:LPS export ABC transporter periplasmic protein LptC [Chitinophagaceae bacterium]
MISNKQIISSNIARNFFSGILFCASINFGACKNTNEEIEHLTGESKARKSDKAKDVTMYYSDKGQLKAVIYAKEFIRNDDAKPAYTDIKKDLKVDFYDDSLQVESTLTAKSARIFEVEGNVIVRENVCVTNKKGEKLNTEELVWNQKMDKFYTNKKVTITTPPNQVLVGDALEANADFSLYKITKLKGNIEVENNDIPK